MRDVGEAMKLGAANDASEAWRRSLDNVQENGHWCDGVTDVTSVGSGFGDKPRRYLEVIADGVEINCPRKRIIGSEARQFSMGFAVANTIWAFSGSNKVEDIVRYNSRGKAFSGDGETFACSIGSRIFGPPSQYRAILERLKQDSSSRRACVVTLDRLDVLNPPKDTPCSIAIQFLLRLDKLHCVTFMRSQSALMVWPYDVFLFTMVQERLSLELDVKLGTYSHFCGSLHVYEDELDLLRTVAAEIPVNGSGTMPPMEIPPIGFEGLVEFERTLRKSTNPKRELVDARAYLGDYWFQLLDPVADMLQHTM